MSVCLGNDPIKAKIGRKLGIIFCRSRCRLRETRYLMGGVEKPPILSIN
jgi:hypothetical protein